MTLSFEPSVYDILDFYDSIILFIILLSLIPQILKKNPTTKYFFNTCISVLPFAVSDILFNIFSISKADNAGTILKIAAFIYYGIQPFLFYSFICYLKCLFNPNTKRSKYWYSSYIFIVMYLILMVLTPFFGLFYSIDENNIYHRGPIHFISVAIDGLFMIMGFFYVIKNRKKAPAYELISYISFFIIPSIIEFIQLGFPEFKMIATGLTVPIVIIFANTHKNLEKTLSYTKHYAKTKQLELINLQHNTILSLSNLVENRGYDKGNHVIRIAKYVKAIANQAMKNHIYEDTITPEYIEMIEQSVPLHDIGKIVVPDAVLNKQGKLNETEFNLMKQHAVEGAKIVKMILAFEKDQKQVRMAQNIAKYHHEKWDGSGYPEGLKAHEIPLSARLMAIADVFDALASSRVYKNSTFSLEESFNIIEKNSGTAFDPILVQQFLLVKEEIAKIIENDGVI